MIDANLGVATVTSVPYSAEADRCLNILETESAEIMAPSLWEYEVLSALRKSVHAGHLDTHAGQRCMRALLKMDVRLIHPTAELYASALGWADRLGHAHASDAIYLAVAEAFDAPFWTADLRLVRRCRQLGLDWVKSVQEDLPAG